MNARRADTGSRRFAGMRRVLWMFAITYLAALGMLTFFENRLVYPVPQRLLDSRPPDSVETVYFESADGTKLHGWFHHQPGNSQTLIYFHGNAEDVDRAWRDAARLASIVNADLLVFDYRGYGLSEGQPSQAGLIADGIAAVEWVTTKTGVDSSQLLLVGRSLGSGVASAVAAQKPPKALVLVCSFNAMVEVAASQYPIFPVRWLMRNRFDSNQALNNALFPVLIVHGTEDSIVPIKFSRSLFDAIPSPHKRFVEIPNRGHNDIGSEDFARELLEFLDR